jgi:hypothetical protein
MAVIAADGRPFAVRTTEVCPRIFEVTKHDHGLGTAAFKLLRHDASASRTALPIAAIGSHDGDAAWPHPIKRFYGSTAREALQER